MDLRSLTVAARCGDCTELQAGLMKQQQAGGSLSRQHLLTSLLTAAAAWGQLSAVQFLLRAGAAASLSDIWMRDASEASAGENLLDCSSGATALHLAIRRGHKDVVSELLAAGRQLVNARDEDGVTPLADCCQHELPELAGLLLGSGADPNAACRRYQRRPLHWAACAGDQALTLRLIEAGADPGALDWRRRTAADVADTAGHHRLAMWLRTEAGRWQESPGQTFLPDVVSSNAPERLPQQYALQQQQLSRFRSESEPPPQQQQSATSQLPRHQQQQQPATSQLPRHQQQQQPATSQLPRHQEQPRIPSCSPGWDAPPIDLSQSQPSAAFPQPPCTSASRRFTDPYLLPPPALQLPEPVYSMSTNPRGLCLVLSNENYAKLQPRPGTQHDAERIEQLFEQRLGFVVEVRTDLTGQQMLDAAAKAAKKTHRHRYADAFVCFLLAHGDSGGHVYGVDGASVSVNDIAAAFDVVRCPELAGKPKAFFVQACRGTKEVVAAVTTAAPPELDGPAAALRSPTTPLAVSPEGADFIFGFACCENRPAYRCSSSGSIFVQTLCDVFEESLGSGDDPSAEVDVDNALVEVRRRICAAPIDQGGASMRELGTDGHCVYMVPQVQSTLRFRLRFGVCGM